MDEKFHCSTADSSTPIPQEHKKIYQLLFSFPEMVRDALKRIPEPWVDERLRHAFALTVLVALIRLGLVDEIENVTDPEEIKNMLAANLLEWRDRVHEEGRKEGHEEGRKEGHEEGRKEGQLEGGALVVSHLIQLKYGALDESTQKRITEADSKTLLRWADRVLTAERLSDVFLDD
jgi:hypothetical protein